MKARSKSGTSIIEVPFSIWLILTMVLMPMLAMGTVTLRASLMNAVVQDGAHAAAKAKTFETGTVEKPSAMTLAKQTILEMVAKFPGLTVDSIDTDILITNVETGSKTRSEDKLSLPADSSKFIYQIETIATGKIDPIFAFNSDMFGSIPGLNAPVVVSYVAREMAENPQGLDK
jgi:hypothetical protein